MKEGLDRLKDLWEGGKGGEGGGEGRGGEVRGRFKAVGRRGRGRDIRLECKVVVQVLGHGGVAKGKRGFGEDFRWMVLGGEEKRGGVVVDFVEGGGVREWAGGEEVFGGRGGEFGVDYFKEKGGGGGGEGGPLSPRSYTHNKTRIIRDRSSMGKCISALIQGSFNVDEGHITRETVNKGFQAEMKREKKGVLWRGVVLETLNNDFRVSKHRKGANISRAEVGGKVEGIDTSNKFRLIGGSKRCSGGKASDFFSKMVNNGARAPLERDSTRSSIKENTKREVRGLSPWIRG